MNYLKTLEKIYFKNQKEKILGLARELYNNKEISLKQLQDTYFLNFVRK